MTNDTLNANSISIRLLCYYKIDNTDWIKLANASTTEWNFVKDKSRILLFNVLLFYLYNSMLKFLNVDINTLMAVP